MKKFILPIIILLIVAFFLPRKTNAQTEQDCRKIFNKESYKCLGVSGDCQRKCGEETKRPDGGAYFNSGEVYSKCTKASDCDGKGQACNEQALANFRACQDAGKQPAAAEAKQETPKQETKSAAQTISDWIMENDLISDPAWLEQMEREKLNFELYGRTPQMTEEIIKKAQSEWEAMFTKTNEENVAVVNGRGQFTTPEGFIVLGPHDKPLKITFIDDTFINPNSETTQLNYTWDTSSGAVVSMPQQSEIKFLKSVQDEKTQELKRMLKLNKGEVEIKVKNDNKKDKFGVRGDFFDLFVIQTHFWVNQSQDKNLAVIGVYEGEVEVKTRDGKTIKIKPDGGKPGVVVVSQKLSFTKLVFLGLALAVVFGGVVFFLRKRFSLKSFKKRR